MGKCMQPTRFRTRRRARQALRKKSADRSTCPSTKKRMSPRATAAPACRAGPGPVCTDSTRRTHHFIDASSRKARVPSVLRLSTTMSSCSSSSGHWSQIMRMECRVYHRFAPSLRAGMITEYMVVIVVGAHALFEEPVHDDGADVRREMLDNRLERQAQLRMSDEVVVNAIFDGVGIGDAVRASEAMHPAQPGQAQAAAAAAAELLVQIALLAAEAAKTRIEPRPGGCAARE